MGNVGTIFGIVGALEAFPRRLAARAVEAAGGQLRLNVNGGASQVNGTIIINGSSVNLNTTPTVP